MTVELLKREDEAKWDEFVMNHPDSTIYHKLGYREVISRTFGHQPLYLIAREGDQIVGVLPLIEIRSRLFKNSLISLPFCNYGGALASNPAVESALTTAAQTLTRQKKLDYLEMRYVKARPVTKTTVTSKVTMIVDLERSVDAMWKKLRDKNRNQIRRARLAGLVSRADPHLVNDFYGAFADNMRFLGTPVLPKSYFVNLARQFRKAVTFLVVYRNKKPLAGACLLRYQSTLEVPYSGALWLKYRACYPNMLLFWECLRLGIELKCRRFDFGRSTKDSSNYEFKRRWRANPVQLYYEQYTRDNQPVNLSPGNPKYRILTKIWRHLPFGLANYFGPKIIRGLP